MKSIIDYLDEIEAWAQHLIAQDRLTPTASYQAAISAARVQAALADVPEGETMTVTEPAELVDDFDREGRPPGVTDPVWTIATSDGQGGTLDLTGEPSEDYEIDLPDDDSDDSL